MTPEEWLKRAKKIPIPSRYEWALSDKKRAIGLVSKSKNMSERKWVCYAYLNALDSFVTLHSYGIGHVNCYLGNGLESFQFGEDIEAALQFIAHRALMLGTRV
jgi:hypothetical protein